jgi:DNA-binding NarL/FixJ family response regulator
MSPFQRQPAHASLEEHISHPEDPMIAPTTLSRRNETQGTSCPPPAFREIRVLVVDDHPAVRLGIRRLLGDQPDFVLAGVTGTAEAAISIAEREPIDVVVSDYHLGSRNGLWLSRKLKRLSGPPRVLIYSAFADGTLAAGCVVAEADGLVSKGRVGAELCDAIRGVARGWRLPPHVPQPLAGMMRDRLDPGEQAIFGMLLAGIAPAEVARTLDLSRSELESRLSSLLGKIEELPDVALDRHAGHTRLGSRRPVARRNVG